MKNKQSIIMALAAGLAFWTQGLFGGSVQRIPSAEWNAWLEDEWLKIARYEAEDAQSGELTPASDAAGGCDGIINGRWGFHTDREKEPWWQVDLGAVHPLARVGIWNRSDSESCARRASGFRLLLSDDGDEWREVYRHPGEVFYGYHMPDRRPLTIRLKNQSARYVRVQLPGEQFLHLDEVQVIGAARGAGNLALNRPSDQSSVSKWSTRKAVSATDFRLSLDSLFQRAQGLATARRAEGRISPAQQRTLADFVKRIGVLKEDAPETLRKALYLELRGLVRDLALADPLLDFDAILLTKRVPGSFNHMSDQYYGWWSRPGGGIYALRDFKGDSPALECLSGAFPEPGSFLRPDLSHDGKKVLFAWCRHYPKLSAEKDKLNKANVPEDAFYHVYEMNVDGSNPRRLTKGKYDNFDARYLSDGRIVFLSTRRGQALQVTRETAARSLECPDLPDVYVRCGGDERRPVAVYTLHTMNADGGDLTPISPFEMFEWEPSIANDGTVIYARWDYVDRDNMPYMSLWSMNPDGTNARLVYGNHTKAPHCVFEPRSVPGSSKIVFTASGHHAQTMGSLVLLDPAKGVEGDEPVERLTPTVPFPEIEGWAAAQFANPWPLSERLHLVSWGVEESVKQGGLRAPNGMGLCLFDADGGLEPIYRDAEISSMYPIPLRARTKPPVVPDTVDWEGPQEGCFLVADVYRGMKGVPKGAVKALRVVAVPAKTQPWMNKPSIGLTRDDPGKVALGTVPVEADGSAWFRAPSGVSLFFQALDEDGLAVQTMRSATHLQPGQTLACVGCHEERTQTPPAELLAMAREPSKIAVGPEGSWPFRYDRLVQPVLDSQCVRCHNPQSDDALAAAFDLSPEKSYETLVDFGEESLRKRVLEGYRRGFSIAGDTPARGGSLWAWLEKHPEHHGVRFTKDARERFIVWMDLYAQRAGCFDEEQEKRVAALRLKWADLLIERKLQPHVATLASGSR